MRIFLIGYYLRYCQLVYDGRNLRRIWCYAILATGKMPVNRQDAGVTMASSRSVRLGRGWARAVFGLEFYGRKQRKFEVPLAIFQIRHSFDSR